VGTGQRRLPWDRSERGRECVRYSGLHAVVTGNTLLLTIGLHKVFDLGYITVDPGVRRIVVSG
jgi:hypothetical protein